MKSAQSYIFVIIQFSGIFYLISGSDRFYNNYLSILLVLPGVLLALWSFWEMRNSVLSVFPDPDLKIKLIRKGPYSILRQPMYSSLFLFLVPLVCINYSLVRLLVLFTFAVNQLFKLLYEEKLLMKKLPEYKSYMLSSWRLVPWIF